MGESFLPYNGNHNCFVDGREAIVAKGLPDSDCGLNLERSTVKEVKMSWW